nr:hypothetical protein [Sporolactobacillus spathodeae]
MINQYVEIRCADGSVHRGLLTHIDEHHAYLQSNTTPYNSPGLFAWGWSGWGFPIAFAAIVAILAIGLLW